MRSKIAEQVPGSHGQLLSPRQPQLIRNHIRNRVGDAWGPVKELVWREVLNNTRIKRKIEVEIMSEIEGRTPAFVIEFTKALDEVYYRLPRKTREAIKAAHPDALVSEQSISIGDDHKRVMAKGEKSLSVQVANILFYLPPGLGYICLWTDAVSGERIDEIQDT